ncbi:hypothetical protein WMY93_028432 [Mugilogobius chulae]|uniref:DUF4201 domain-containing protein n=1 Tax=Mugilogobius chulae TaxID=88201 RepID=A0AAW0N0I7_9GOBI
MKETEKRSEDIKKEKVDFERRLLKPLRENRLDLHKCEKVLQYIQDMSKDFYQDFNEENCDINLDEIRANNIKTQHALSSYKIKKKEHKLTALEVTIRYAEEERLKAEILNDHLQRQIADYMAPDTTEYMLMKEKHRKLQQSILTWERKAGVAETALKTYGKSWAKQRATLTPVNSAETRARSGGHQIYVKLPDIAEHREISLNQMEKCSLKTQSMLFMEKKLQQQLRQRKDLGKADYEDFYQDFNEENCDINLDEIRANNIKTQHALSSYKDKLQRATSDLTNLHKEIKKKEHKLTALEVTIRYAEEERLKAEILNDHLQRQIADYMAPDTTEYMLMKEKHRKLQQSILIWERKAGVAETALKTYGKSWAKQRATLTPVNSAETRARSGGHQIYVKLPDIAEHREISVNTHVNL